MSGTHWEVKKNQERANRIATEVEQGAEQVNLSTFTLTETWEGPLIKAVKTAAKNGQVKRVTFMEGFKHTDFIRVKEEIQKHLPRPVIARKSGLSKKPEYYNS